MIGFWIFLIPQASQHKKYNQITKSLSTDYNSPDIDVHVTILGPLEAQEKDLINKVKSIAKRFERIEVEILGMNYTNTVTQCVFAQIKMSPKLLTLYKELELNLQYTNKSPFFPHMSLLYGDFSPEEKENISGQIKTDNKLLLDKLVIFREGPLPSDWFQVAEFELN
jgi:2'-5' RNA ligase